MQPRVKTTNLQLAFYNLHYSLGYQWFAPDKRIAYKLSSFQLSTASIQPEFKKTKGNLFIFSADS